LECAICDLKSSEAWRLALAHTQGGDDPQSLPAADRSPAREMTARSEIEPQMNADGHRCKSMTMHFTFCILPSAFCLRPVRRSAFRVQRWNGLFAGPPAGEMTAKTALTDSLQQP
jgi:hypothetical protein